jgi:hypothetical protein
MQQMSEDKLSTKFDVKPSWNVATSNTKGTGE